LSSGFADENGLHLLQTNNNGVDHHQTIVGSLSAIIVHFKVTPVRVNRSAP
jgi:hypothetical protein